MPRRLQAGDPRTKASLLVYFPWPTQCLWGKKKEKCFSKLSTFKNRESSPKKSLDFHFLIITTKANTSVSSTTCLALFYMTYSYSLLCSSGQFRGAGIFIIIPFYSWGNRGKL